MSVFKMSELVMISKDGFPYSNVWVKEESVISNNLQSIFLIVLRRGNQSSQSTVDLLAVISDRVARGLTGLGLLEL